MAIKLIRIPQNKFTIRALRVIEEFSKYKHKHIVMNPRNTSTITAQTFLEVIFNQSQDHIQVGPMKIFIRNPRFKL